jgi:hypothetical protein
MSAQIADLQRQVNNLTSQFSAQAEPAGQKSKQINLPEKKKGE